MAARDVGLIREGGGIGDVVRISSVARALKRRGTERVTFYGLAQYADLASIMEGIDRFVPLSFNLRQRRPRSSRWTVAPYLQRTVSNRHDQIVDGWCPAFVYEQVAEPVEWSRSEVFVRAAGIVPAVGEDLRPVLRPSALVDVPPRAVGVALRATGPDRTYSASQSRAVVAGILERGYTPVVIDSADSEHAPQLSGPRVLSCTGKLLSEVAAVLARCEAVVAVDSGILHMAGALGIPTVGIFGPTDPAVMLRQYPTHVGVTAEDYRGGESPCGQPCWFRPSRGFSARLCRPRGCYWINRIRPEQVLQAFDGVLREAQPA